MGAAPVVLWDLGFSIFDKTIYHIYRDLAKNKIVVILALSFVLASIRKKDLNRAEWR